MITDEDKLVAREIKQDCYSPFSDGYGGWSEFDEDETQKIISAYRQRIEARCSLQFGEFNRRREDDIVALREENARLREDAKQNAITADQWKREAERIASARLAPAQGQVESDIVSAWEESGYSSEGEAFAASLGYTKDHLLYWEAATFYDGYKAALASARPAPVQERGKALVRRISAELHRLPKNSKGHEIGMMEVGYDSNGQLNYGPLWLSVDETDAILLGIYRAILADEPAYAKPADPKNPCADCANSVGPRTDAICDECEGDESERPSMWKPRKPADWPLGEKCGTYTNLKTGEYVLVWGGKIVGGYKDTGDAKRNEEIDRLMWAEVFERMKGG